MCAGADDLKGVPFLTQFSDLGLDRPILDALATAGYAQPTPIQAMAIPHVLAGGDLLGIASTGTGKTAAFALPILQNLAAARDVAPRGACRALVLAPTRELAAQIGDSFRDYGRNFRLKIAVTVGGVAYQPQTAALAKGIDVLVATPGRLLDHMSRGSARLDGASVLVLDEADHMLDLGFIPAVRKLMTQIPRKRQSLFFSATMPGAIRALADEFLRAPQTVSAAPSATPPARIEQRLIHVEQRRKSGLLADIVRDGGDGRVLVFTRTKRGADRVVRGLITARINAVAIHGNKSQGQRERALAGFRAGHAPVLVATDIAARGIDVDGIRLVVNYDLPNVAETYVHRIGRTGRTGAAGAAIAFCSPEERPLLRAIEALLRMRIPADGDSAAPPRQTRRPARGATPAVRRAPNDREPRLAELPFMRATTERKSAPAQRHRKRRPTRKIARQAAAMAR